MNEFVWMSMYMIYMLHFDVVRENAR